MREFKYGVGVIATIFLLNLLLVKLSEKSSTKTDFRGKNQKDMSHDGNLSIKFKILFLNPLNFLGEKNSQKYFLEKMSRRNCFGGFDAQFLRFGEKISEKKSFSD